MKKFSMAMLITFFLPAALAQQNNTTPSQQAYTNNQINLGSSSDEKDFYVNLNAMQIHPPHFYPVTANQHFPTITNTTSAIHTHQTSNLPATISNIPHNEQKNDTIVPTHLEQFIKQNHMIPASTGEIWITSDIANMDEYETIENSSVQLILNNVLEKGLFVIRLTRKNEPEMAIHLTKQGFLNLAQFGVLTNALNSGGIYQNAKFINHLTATPTENLLMSGQPEQWALTKFSETGYIGGFNDKQVYIEKPLTNFIKDCGAATAKVTWLEQSKLQTLQQNIAQRKYNADQNNIELTLNAFAQAPDPEGLQKFLKKNITLKRYTITRQIIIEKTDRASDNLIELQKENSLLEEGHFVTPHARLLCLDKIRNLEEHHEKIGKTGAWLFYKNTFVYKTWQEIDYLKVGKKWSSMTK